MQPVAPKRRARLAWGGLLLAGLVVAAAWWWLGLLAAPAPQVVLAAPPAGRLASALADGNAAAAGRSSAWPRKPASDSQAAILTPDLRLDIETLFMEELGEGSFQSDPVAFKKRLLARLRAKYPVEQASLMQDLVARYVDYRVALGGLSGSAGEAGNPQALRASMATRMDLRRQFFSDAEYDALFAAQDRLDRYSLDRLDIMRNQHLSASERDSALQEAENQFTPQERAQRGEWAQQISVARQTAEYESQGTSDQQRYAERSAQLGEAAAQRLGQLDQDNRQWQARLQQYATARQQQAAGQMSAGDLTALRNQMFTPQEQLRLNAALELLQQQHR